MPRFLQPERPCEICRNPQATPLEREYVEKRLSTQDVIDKLGITKYAWYRHIKYHLKPGVAQAISDNSEFLATQIIDKTGELIESLDRLKAKVEQIHVTVTGDADPSKVRAYTALETELRNTLMALAKIQGDFKDSAYIQVNNISIELNKIGEMVMTHACPKCKPVFAEKLGELNEV